MDGSEYDQCKSTNVGTEILKILKCQLKIKSDILLRKQFSLLM